MLGVGERESVERLRGEDKSHAGVRVLFLEAAGCKASKLSPDSREGKLQSNEEGA